ncbi:MAG: hypothetical protein KME10_03880 [Plectolyngbya sp. WJT66-NPBG17]|jgi:hypothetical protein|nr:hypothetical protein [Plectolyngbya sp. WJT66-NPBG17]MBW4528078.1 hypothetical protein [Phormidium tanganyikae FI6-MK23]
MTRKFDYRVRVQVAAESPDGILLDFLKNERHRSYSHKEMLLWALRAYWMPIAYQLRREQGEQSLTEAQLKRMAQDAIYQLRQQIAYLRSTFGIEQPSSTEEALSPQLAQQFFSLLASHQSAEVDGLVQSSAISSGLTISSGSLQPESTVMERESADSHKELWYDSEDLFESEI